MSDIQYGSTLVEQPAKFTENSDGSGTTVYSYVGSQAQIIGKYQQLKAQDFYTFTFEGGLTWTMDASLPYNALAYSSEPEPEPQWNIEGNAGEQNILESNISIVTTLGTDTKERILQALKNPNKNIPLVAPTSGSQLTNATKVYNYMKIGADSKRFNTVTVTRQITVSRRYVSSWDLRYVGTVLSKLSLANTTNMPSWVQVLLPNSAYIDKGNGITAFAGFLEEHPKYQNVANNKVQISQAWIYNEWISDYYTIV